MERTILVHHSQAQLIHQFSEFLKRLRMNHLDQNLIVPLDRVQKNGIDQEIRNKHFKDPLT